MNDPLLPLLIDIAEESEVTEGVPKFNRPITLTIGGILVSGFIVSRKEFLMSDDLIFRRVWERFLAPEVAAPPPLEDGKDEPQKFIHLRDTKFFTPDHRPIPTDHGVYWRGRLSAVDGFFLGGLGFKEVKT
jgi:hypothetical protein